MDPEAPFWSERAPDQYRARFETTRGNFVLEVQRDLAPRGADRFYNLIRSGFYDDSRFYRVTRGFVQFGIPGDPAISAVWRDRRFPDDSVKSSNLRGYFAYAMTGPDARTTQIYVLKEDRPYQDAQGFAPFGRVVEGMDVVDSLYVGYGENSGGGMRAGRQAPLFEGGNAYLDANYPKLDKLLRARIEQDSGVKQEDQARKKASGE
ncbi:MAG: peptidylprolyl isomerase [Gemmatimonadetes bacterium]|nr:peptidylprolyl isomerase [Gemmatimonadota bacterium]